MRKRERLAYIAGIADNQGSISIVRRTKPGGFFNYELSFVIYHRRTSILEFIQQFFEAGKIYPDRQGYQLQFGANQTVAILTQILPYLILRKEEANLAIEFQTKKQYDTRPISEEQMDFRRSCYLRMKELKKR